MRPTWITIDEGFAHRCGRISILTDTKAYWAATECQNYTDCMWRRTYCCIDIRGQTIFLGRWRLWTIGTSWYPVHAKGWRWLSILANAKNDLSSQKPRCQRSFLWKSTYCGSFKNRSSLFLGCWSLRSTRASRHLDISSWWGWLSILAYS